MKFSHYLAGAAVATVLSATPALAQSPVTAEEVAAMRAEMQAMRQRMAEMEAQLAAQQAQIETAQATSDSAVKTAAAAEKAAGETKISWKGAPQLETDSGWSFKPRGRLLYDVAHVGSPSGISDPGLGFSNEVRRARLGVQGSIPGGFGYKFEADFATGEVEITDAFLDYSHKGLTVTVGQHNGFQSLEELSSSNDTSFIERAAFTDAFGFERRVGASVQYATGPLLLQGGVFTDNIHDLDDDENDGVGVDGRVVYAPKLGETQLHLGASAHWRDLGDAVDTARYRQRPLVHSTDTRFIDTGTLMNASSETSWGAEAAVIAGRFHAAGEAYWQKLGRSGGMSDPKFFGGSVEAGFFLTDNNRGYKGGIFRGPKVKNGLDNGGMGAFQLNVRYDRLDLTDGSAGVFGGKQDGYMASAIWWPVEYVRFMLNYGHLVYDDAAVVQLAGDGDYSVDVFGARAQIVF